MKITPLDKSRRSKVPKSEENSPGSRDHELKTGGAGVGQCVARRRTRSPRVHSVQGIQGRPVTLLWVAGALPRFYQTHFL